MNRWDLKEKQLIPKISMVKLKRWLYAFAILIFSALLVAYAYDIEQGTHIGLSSTQAGRQEILMSVARALGFKGSIVVAVLATGAGLLAVMKRRHQSRKKHY